MSTGYPEIINTYVAKLQPHDGDGVSPHGATMIGTNEAAAVMDAAVSGILRHYRSARRRDSWPMAAIGQVSSFTLIRISPLRTVSKDVQTKGSTLENVNKGYKKTLYEAQGGVYVPLMCTVQRTSQSKIFRV